MDSPFPFQASQGDIPQRMNARCLRVTVFGGLCVLLPMTSSSEQRTIRYRCKPNKTVFDGRPFQSVANVLRYTTGNGPEHVGPILCRKRYLKRHTDCYYPPVHLPPQNSNERNSGPAGMFQLGGLALEQSVNVKGD